MPTLINLFEVPTHREEAFLAAWTHAREFLDERAGTIPTTLYRSLSPDAEFRFVNVAQIHDLGPWRAAVMSPEFPGRGMPGRPHPALYDVVREHRNPEGEAARVVLINAFEVPPAEDDAFLASWERARDALSRHPGYRGTRLSRSTGDDARFRFVNVSPWPSPEAFGAALQLPEYQSAAQAMRHPAHPMLYEVVRS
jgi:heme-degrading monooxygenase HmoA